ncbi:unnamed protein product [Camellia sinensis]
MTCPQNWYSFHINCGGKEVTLDGNTKYEADTDSGGPSRFFLSGTNWAFSSTGYFLDTSSSDFFICTNTSRLCMKDSDFYTVNLHFAEIMFTDDKTYSSLGRPIFDVYIQDGYTKEVTGPEAVLVINLPEQTGRKLGKPGILVTSIGWANTATINIVYDVLQMMGRDDIPVGLGDVLAKAKQTHLSFSLEIASIDRLSLTAVVDSWTPIHYGFAHCLPRSPRRYTAENSVKYGAPGDTDHPELRHPLALDIWKSVIKSLDPGSKITALTNGPSTTLSQIVLFENTSSVIQDVYIVWGHISLDDNKRESELDITLIPLDIQRSVCSFRKILEKLQLSNKTPEGVFACRLLSRLWHLQQKHHSIITRHVLVAEILTSDNLDLNLTFQSEPLKILVISDILRDGQITIDRRRGKSAKILKSVDQVTDLGRDLEREIEKSAVMGSVDEQKRIWSTPHQDQV